MELSDALLVGGIGAFAGFWLAYGLVMYRSVVRSSGIDLS